jgi:prepilin-type N-terminal cleavage/methylation domain-containing protein
MTTSIAKSEARSQSGIEKFVRRARAGFSVVELMIAMTISSMALAAVLSTVTFVARSTVSTTDYADMDREARSGLEIFARDVRMAQGVLNFTANSVTLDVVRSSGTSAVPYTYVPSRKTFYRFYGTSAEQALITNIESFRLSRYSIALDVNGQPTEATQDIETKQIQLELRSVRSGPAKAFASNNVVSARYILRNKDAH